MDFASIELPHHHLISSDSEVKDSVECLPSPWALTFQQISSLLYVLSSHIHADHLELKGPVPGGSLLLLTLPGFLTLTAHRHSASIPSVLTLVRPCCFHAELPKLKPMSHTRYPPHQGCPPLISSLFITHCPHHHLVPCLSLCTQATISTAFSRLFIHPSSLVKVYC